MNVEKVARVTVVGHTADEKAATVGLGGVVFNAALHGGLGEDIAIGGTDDANVNAKAVKDEVAADGVYEGQVLPNGGEVGEILIKAGTERLLVTLMRQKCGAKLGGAIALGLGCL